MAKHVDGRLGLFEDDVSYQGLISAVGRVHVEKQNFAVNRWKAFQSNFNGSADICCDHLLRCGFAFDGANGIQSAELRPPGSRQDQVRGTRVH